MALGNPLDAYMQMAQMRNKNQQDMVQNISGIGEGLGQGISGITEAMQAKKKQDTLKQLLAAMRGQGAPQEGPQNATPDPAIVGPAGYVPPGAGPEAVPAGQPSQYTMQPNPQSGMGAPPQDNTQLINSLMMQFDPQAGIKAYMDQQDPYRKALTAQANATAEKERRPPKPNPEWSPVSGTLSKNGRALEISKYDGEIREAGPDGIKSTGYGSTMGPLRKAQYTIQDLPSNQPAHTAGGAAYQVKIGARQGKNLVARPGSPQRTAAAAADLVRAITRVAPTDEGLKNANFSDNLLTRWSVIKQKITADPSAVDNPKIRKEMYDIFDEMDKSATPFIQNQLEDMTDAGLPMSPETRKRQLGETLPDIPFDPGAESAGKIPVFLSVKEAEAAKLPPGTKIKINGRAATVQ